MAICTCLTMFLVRKKKKYTHPLKASYNGKKGGNGEIHVKSSDLSSPFSRDGNHDFHHANSESFSNIEERSSSIRNMPNNDRLVRAESGGDAAYEGGDEHDEIEHDKIQLMKRDYSDFDLHVKCELVNSDVNNCVADNKMEANEGITDEVIFARGHVSDPGIDQSTFWASSPVLKRSCSNIEIKRANNLINSSKRSSSYGEFKNSCGNDIEPNSFEYHNSPLSAKTSFSADRVILKKRSSCQVLPSRSRKILWKLFLWSNENLRKPSASRKLPSAVSKDDQKFDYSDMKPKSMEFESKWAAFFSKSSPRDRVNAWVNSLQDCAFCPVDDEDFHGESEDGSISGPHHMETGEFSRTNNFRTTRRISEGVIQTNSILQSLNSFSSVAHISSMGLKAIPSISAFGCLRSVSLCGNFIASITPGCLPKHIHSLDLSRNRISTIEGLRDLTRLRVLNLSYNRISRIGHGLSNCTTIKELNLAGNKIGDVDGLHRLLKLAVLDLSFNKLSTTKAFGQLVANYNSVVSLNLIGNPIQSNIGEDQTRKAVIGLLPRITYFNKLPIKQNRAREFAANVVAKAAVGDSGWRSRQRPTKRLGRDPRSSAKSRIGEGSLKERSRLNGKLYYVRK